MRRVAMLIGLVGVLATEPAGAASPSRCQRAIEKGARRYMDAVLRIADDCVAAGGDQSAVGTCLYDTLESDALAGERDRWARRVLRRCSGLAPGGDLGYQPTCAGWSTGGCVFPTPAIDVPGDSNDVLDCLACQMRRRVRLVTTRLYAGGAASPGTPLGACAAAISAGGRAAFRVLDREMYRCMRRRRSTSIAACVDDPAVASLVEAAMANWRAEAVTACAGVPPSPGSIYGYGTRCDGDTGFPGQPCRTFVPPCTFGSTTKLDAPGGEDDLLDCLRCQVEEAELGLAREVQGANLCCTADGCRTVMTRAACERAGGHPAYYRIDDAGVSGFHLPHGLAFASDGTMYVADHSDGSGSTPYAATVAPDGTRTVLATFPGPGVPTGIAVDADRNAYVSIPCGVNNVVYEVTPAGEVSLFAGTPGVAGHTDDGASASGAFLVGARKVGVAPSGAVLLTESGVLSLQCPADGVAANAEYVRMVDADGTLRTIAGSGAYGSAGEGGPALAAQLGLLLSMAVAPDGALLLGEGGTQRLLRLAPLPPAAGTLTRLAGRATNPIGAYGGDGGPARLARFFSIEGIVQDADGNVIVSDFQNNRIRLIDAAGSIITIAGNGVTSVGPGPASGDGGPGALAFVGCPQELAQAPDGRLWFHNQLGARYFRTLTRVPF